MEWVSIYSSNRTYGDVSLHVLKRNVTPSKRDDRKRNQKKRIISSEKKKKGSKKSGVRIEKHAKKEGWGGGLARLIFVLSYRWGGVGRKKKMRAGRGGEAIPTAALNIVTGGKDGVWKNLCSRRSARGNMVMEGEKNPRRG